MGVPVTAAEAFRHLQSRLAIQRHEKTSYNRLRWNGADLDALDAMLRYSAGAAAELRQLRHRVVVLEREAAGKPTVVRPHELDDGR